MTNKTMRVMVAALMALLVMGGCKRKETTTVVQTPSAGEGAPAQQSPPAAASTAAPATGVAATPAPAGAPAGKSFDMQGVPVSTAKIPPFPFLEIKGDNTHAEEKTFDRVYVIAGDQLRPVEGHFKTWWPDTEKMSALEAYRNYDNAIRALGAVRVNTVSPVDPAFVQRNGDDERAIYKRLRIPNVAKDLPEDVPGFSQYLLRTPDRNIWITLNIFDTESVNLVVLEEKAMEQKVKPLQAAAMATAIGKEGHVALYLNFDTDSDTIRSDSQPIVSEITKLLRADSQLNLKVEGHTDSSGNAAHNRELSRRRAESVVNAVTAQGIDAKRLAAVGLGADKPLVDNATEEGRARNRRVELVKV